MRSKMHTSYSMAARPRARPRAPPAGTWMGAAAPVAEALDEAELVSPDSESKLLEVAEPEAEAAVPVAEVLPLVAAVEVAEPEEDLEVELLALAALQNWVTWFWTDDLRGSLGQLL